MKFKTCEEYVLAELAETQEQLEKCRELITKLSTDLSHNNECIKNLVSLIKLQGIDSALSSGRYYRFDVDEFDYKGTPNEKFKLVQDIVEEFKDDNKQ